MKDYIVTSNGTRFRIDHIVSLTIGRPFRIVFKDAGQEKTITPEDCWGAITEDKRFFLVHEVVTGNAIYIAKAHVQAYEPHNVNPKFNVIFFNYAYGECISVVDSLEYIDAQMGES
jgi:hypothetical protein